MLMRIGMWMAAELGLAGGPPTGFSLAEILVLVGGAILPAPVVTASTMISAALKSVWGPTQFTREGGVIHGVLACAATTRCNTICAWA